MRVEMVILSHSTIILLCQLNGRQLNGKQYHDYTDDASWGPRISGQEYIPWYAWYPGTQYSFKTASLNPQPDNARDFWETGITNNTNISLGQSGNGYVYRVSYTNQYIKGMLPNSSSNRNTLFATLSGDLGQHFTVGLNGTYSSQKIRGEFDDDYGNQSTDLLHNGSIEILIWG